MSTLAKVTILVLVALAILAVAMVKKQNVANAPLLPSESQNVQGNETTTPSKPSVDGETATPKPLPSPTTALKSVVAKNPFAMIEECGTGYARIFRVSLDVRTPDAGSEIYNTSGTHIASCGGYQDEISPTEPAICTADMGMCKRVFYPAQAYEGDSNVAVDVYNLK